MSLSSLSALLIPTLSYSQINKKAEEKRLLRLASKDEQERINLEHDYVSSRLCKHLETTASYLDTDEGRRYLNTIGKLFTKHIYDLARVEVPRSEWRVAPRVGDHGFNREEEAEFGVRHGEGDTLVGATGPGAVQAQTEGLELSDWGFASVTNSADAGNGGAGTAAPAAAAAAPVGGNHELQDNSIAGGSYVPGVGETAFSLDQSSSGTLGKTGRRVSSRVEGRMSRSIMRKNRAGGRSRRPGRNQSQDLGDDDTDGDSDEEEDRPKTSESQKERNFRAEKMAKGIIIPDKAFLHTHVALISGLFRYLDSDSETMFLEPPQMLNAFQALALPLSKREAQPTIDATIVDAVHKTGFRKFCRFVLEHASELAKRHSFQRMRILADLMFNPPANEARALLLAFTEYSTRKQLQAEYRQLPGRKPAFLCHFCGLRFTGQKALDLHEDKNGAKPSISLFSPSISRFVPAVCIIICIFFNALSVLVMMIFVAYSHAPDNDVH